MSEIESFQRAGKIAIPSICKKEKVNLRKGNYRGFTFLSHVMKVSERVLEMRFTKSIRIDGMQFGFRPCYGTTDAIFIVRELQEKFFS